MPTGVVHPFWIESLEEAACQIANARVVVVSPVATAEGPPAANGHLRGLAIPLCMGIVSLCPRDGFGDQVEESLTAHHRKYCGSRHALPRRRQIQRRRVQEAQVRWRSREADAVVGMQVLMSRYDASVAAANAIIEYFEQRPGVLTQVDTVGWYDRAELVLREPE